MTAHQFPVITHISDVLPAIEGDKAFVVVEKEGYTVINYVLQIDATFPPVNPSLDAWQHDYPGEPGEFSEYDLNAAIRRECRGLIFCSKTGKVLSRRLHKFFNVGERLETHVCNIDWAQHHYITEKLDGSMITPLWLGNHFRLATKMGVTDVAMNAETFIADKKNYYEFFEYCHKNDITPIFEWCSRNNRIVIDYPEDKLVLLAIRDNFRGTYMDRSGMDYSVAKGLDIPIVRTFDDYSGDIDLFIQYTKNLEDQEGFVVCFENGARYKIKADNYIRLHRVKEAISSERRIVDLIVNQGIDDLKSIFDKEDYDKVTRYETDFWHSVKQQSDAIYSMVDMIVNVRGLGKKEFALETDGEWHPILRAIAFKTFDNLNHDFTLETTQRIIRDKIHSNRSFDEVKKALFPNVSYRSQWDSSEES